MPKVAVVGGGILGLVTLFRLIREFPHFEFHLFASEIFNRKTCSFRKGGFVDPFLAKGKHVPDWTLETYRFFESMSGKAPGIMRRRLNVFFEEPRDPPAWLRLLPSNAEVAQIETDPFGNGWTGGYQANTFVLDQELFLPWLLGICGNANLQWHRKAIDSVSTWHGFDLVVGGLGLGARNFGIDDVVPVRGQWTLLEGDLGDRDFEPGNAKSSTAGNGVYVGPEGSDSILTYLVGGDGWTILGGTYQENDLDSTFREEEQAVYFERAERMFPDLSTRAILSKGVQFRPAGREPRVERRVLEGHIPFYILAAPGGAGVSLCAGYAAQVIQMIRLEDRELF